MLIMCRKNVAHYTITTYTPNRTCFIICYSYRHNMLLKNIYCSNRSCHTTQYLQMNTFNILTKKIQSKAIFIQNLWSETKRKINKIISASSLRVCIKKSTTHKFFTWKPTYRFTWKRDLILYKSKNYYTNL